MPPYIKQTAKGGFLIFSGEWHDGLLCPTKEGTPGGGTVVNLCTLAHISLLFHTISTSDKISFHFNDLQTNVLSNLDST